MANPFKKNFCKIITETFVVDYIVEVNYNS